MRAVGAVGAVGAVVVRVVDAAPYVQYVCTVRLVHTWYMQQWVRQYSRNMPSGFPTTLDIVADDGSCGSDLIPGRHISSPPGYGCGASPVFHEYARIAVGMSSRCEQKVQKYVRTVPQQDKNCSR